MDTDIICFSHLRWNFVYQRPQHLLSRFSKKRWVFFVEEPIFDASQDYNSITKVLDNDVWVIVPHIEANQSSEEIIKRQKALLDSLLQSMGISHFISWYYSPMALLFTQHLTPEAIVYDCMDELSAFKFAPPMLVQMESDLLKKADVVFTGGHSLFEAKKNKHHNIFPFPSSIDKQHFLIGRTKLEEPEDQINIPHPRLGFYGVIDERFNTTLISELATLRPDWHFILIGPIVKIEEEALPRNSNIHYLGAKDYKDLPIYLSGWDIAIMPFALNESTQYISPTKTPEYLCGGKPVISTSIKDVVNPYGNSGLVHIADTSEEFITAAESILAMYNYDQWLEEVDAFLSHISWDKTWNEMETKIDEAINKRITNSQTTKEYV